MRTPLTLSAFVLGALPLGALPQSQAIPIPVPVQEGPVFHVASQTWTPRAQSAALLTGKVLYDNACSINFYIAVPVAGSAIDEGRLPTPQDPVLPGKGLSYRIDGFDIAYCTNNGPTTSLAVAHYECYGAGTLVSPPSCYDQTTNTTLASAILLPNAPGRVSGSFQCWIITVDLRNSPLAFDLAASCNGTFDNDPALDNFAWEFVNPGSLPPIQQGPILSGDPFNCPIGAGTGWGGPGSGTGLGTLDGVSVYQGGPAFDPNSFFLGCITVPVPVTSLYHRLRGDVTPNVCGTPYCDGNGSATPCPVGNDNDGSNGIAGCANSAGPGGATLRASVGACTPATGLVGGSLPPGQPGLYFRANNAVGGGSGAPFGNGLRCAGGGVVRLQVRVADAGGNSNTTVPIDGLPGNVLRYQLWYRDPAGGGSGFNFTNGVEIAW